MVIGKISHQLWGVCNGEDVYLFRIENPSGSYIELINYGASLVSINVPDCRNELGNVILGFSSLQGYMDDECYLGATVGRFANRIDGAKFVLDGSIYTLDDNDNGNSNHGGSHGFNTRVFSFNIENDTLSFSLLSKDGDGGYPGNLEFKVNYRWTDNDELKIDYHAVTDQRTIVNFTNHAYFNLNAGKTQIFDHKLTIFSCHVLAVGADYIPTGLIVPQGSLAFNENKISEKITHTDHDKLGLNTCYFFANKDEKIIEKVATLSDAVSGRVMEVLTSYPSLMLYTGDFLRGNTSKQFEPFDGLCLECQYLPDSPNHEHFPTVVLSPGQFYKHSIIFKFSTIT